MADIVSLGGPSKDDSYSYVEDGAPLLQVYNTATKTITLDVLANDGGGKITLWSVDDGNNNTPLADQDLATSDVNGPW